MSAQVAEKNLENFQDKIDNLQKIVDDKMAANDAALKKAQDENLDLKKKLDLACSKNSEMESSLENFKKLQATAPRGVENADSFDAEESEYEVAFNDAMMGSLEYGCTSGNVPASLMEMSRKSLKKQVHKTFRRNFSQPATSTIESLGGLLVTPQALTQRITRVFNESPMMQICNITPVNKDQGKLLIFDTKFNSATWVGDGDAPYIDKTKVPDLGQLTVDVKHLYIGWQILQALLDDADINVAELYMMEAIAETTRNINRSIIKGTEIPTPPNVSSNARPKGIMNVQDYPERSTTAAYTRGTLVTSVEPEANGVSLEGLHNLLASVNRKYRANGTFLMNDNTFHAVTSIKDNNGDPLISKDLLAKGYEDLRLFGKRVVIADDMDDIGAGTFPIAFGDFKTGYTVFTRIQNRMMREGITQPGIVNYFLESRIGGALSSYEAISRYKTQGAPNSLQNSLAMDNKAISDKVKTSKKSKKTGEV